MVKGVVVFDIDGTLLGGGCSDFDIEYSKNQIRQLVATALKNDYGLAINTARFKIGHKLQDYLYSVGVDLHKIPKDAIQLRSYTARKKAKAMSDIQEAYKLTNKRKLLFFDDKPENVDAVRGQGYDAALVTKSKDHGCLLISDAERNYANKHFMI